MEFDPFASHSGPSESPCPLPMGYDRRRCQRHALDGRVKIQRCPIAPHIHQQPLCTLKLCDLSDGGLSAISDVAMGDHEMVTVHFPPRGTEHGFDLPGHVLRCDRDEQGYRVAIHFDCRRAA